MFRRKGRIIAGIIMLLLFMQFFRTEKDNPVTDPTLDFISSENPPERIAVLLKNSCYDCHSHQTIYPWYSNIAPVSWLVSHDVKEGREELNFSLWQNYEQEKKADKLEEIAEVIEENEMPPWFYRPLHPEANITAEQKKELLGWLQASGALEKEGD